MSPDSGFGLPGWFVAFFVVMVLLGIANGVWRVSAARRLARNAGLDPRDAAALTVLSDDGLSATYLASTLTSHSRPGGPIGGAPKSVEDRLVELSALRAKGLVSDAEYEAQRQAILRSI